MTYRDLPSKMVFGERLNYSEFEEDGTLVATGDATCFMDTVCPLIVRTTGVGRPNAVAFLGDIIQYQFSLNNSAEIESTEFPHNWKEGSEIDIHIHWATGGDNNATPRGVKWEIAYSIANHDEVFSAVATGAGESQIPANALKGTMITTVLKIVTPATVTIGSQIILTIKRIASTETVTAPAADVFGLNVGIHYEVNTLGSRQRYIK